MPSIDVRWRSDGTGGSVVEGGELVGFIALVHDWHEPGERTGRDAWVVEWLAEGIAWTQRSLIELEAEPVTDQEQIEELTLKARTVIELGPPEEPPPFGFGRSGVTTNSELRETIQLTSHAVQLAIGRLQVAARRPDEHAAALINIAVVEVAGWLRALDDLLDAVWRKRVSPADRRAASEKVDTALAGPGVAPGLIADEVARRKQTGEPYEDWTSVLVSRHVYFPRDELNGVVWLADALLHRGPLSAVELRQWRAGEEPRWKWRIADEFYPPERRGERGRQKRKREAYENHLQGRDVMGSLNLTGVLIEMEHLFFVLLPD